MTLLLVSWSDLKHLPFLRMRIMEYPKESTHNVVCSRSLNLSCSFSFLTYKMGWKASFAFKALMGSCMWKMWKVRHGLTPDNFDLIPLELSSQSQVSWILKHENLQFLIFKVWNRGYLELDPQKEKEKDKSQDDSECALTCIPQLVLSFRPTVLETAIFGECQGAGRPAVVKSIVNDVLHVIWASSLFMLDQLYPYSKQIISDNYQPEDKSLNVFLMIVLWLAGVKSASQGQRLKMGLCPQILQARMLSFLSHHVQRSLAWCPVNEI